MENKLHILWVNDNPQTAMSMVLMYAIASKTHAWWEDVTVIIWGASATLVENYEIRGKIMEAQMAGVHFTACLACAEMFNTVEQMQKLKIELQYMGQPLTELIKQNAKVLTI